MKEHPNHNILLSLYFRGQSPAEADVQFLDIARKLELYGIHQFEAVVSLISSSILLKFCLSLLSLGQIFVRAVFDEAHFTELKE